MKTLKPFYTILFLLFCQLSYAGAYLGGRIEYDAIGSFPTDLRYGITIYTYTRTGSVQGDRPSLDSVYFGDGSPAATFSRSQRLDLADNITLNIYINTHTYSGSGTYVIHFSQPSFIGSIENLPYSDTIPLYLQTTIVINSFLCNHSSPHLLSIPIFKTPFGKDFVLSRTSYSPTWDSLSYDLDTTYIPGYTFAKGVSLNNINGEFIWKGDSMQSPGHYFFQMRTNAWKYGINVCEMFEDFVILLDTVMNSTSNFITISLPPNFTSTILPNNQFTLHVEYYDSSTTPTVGFYSEFFNQAMFTSIANNHFITGDFTWTPSDQDIRNSPYVLQFRGKKDLTYTIFVEGVYSDTCRSIIGIPETELNGGNISLFPNPTTDDISFNFSSIKSKDVKISLFDITGKLVLEKNLNADYKINISHLLSGIYIVKVNSDNRAFYQKVVKY